MSDEETQPEEISEETSEAEAEPVETEPEEEESEPLTKPPGMPRALFEKLKAQHDAGSQLDQSALLELLDKLTAQEAKADAEEAKFAEMVGLDDWEATEEPKEKGKQSGKAKGK